MIKGHGALASSKNQLERKASMEAQYKTRNGRLTVTVSIDNQKDLFRALSMVAEVVEAESACGCCQSNRIHHRVRTAKGYDFYELICEECGARFEFGQLKEGEALFPKRRDEAGNPLANRGWKVWNGGTGKPAKQNREPDKNPEWDPPTTPRNNPEPRAPRIGSEP
jgi:hypothetical protein